MVAKAVAVVPTGTDRLEGSTAENGEAAAGRACKHVRAKSPMDITRLFLVLVIMTIPFK